MIGPGTLGFAAWKYALWGIDFTGRLHDSQASPVTAVARIEQLDYDTSPPFDLHRRRQTLGARIRIRDSLSTEVNLMHQTGQSIEYGPVAIDIGVTYSVRMRPH